MSCTASIARRDKPIFRAARWSCDEPRPASKGTTGKPAIPWCSRDRTTDRSTACTSSTIRQTGRVQLTISASVSKVIAGGAVACPRVPPTWARLPAPIDPSRDCVRRVASSMARALRMVRATASSEPRSFQCTSTARGMPAGEPIGSWTRAFLARSSQRCCNAVSRAVLPAPGAPWNRRVALLAAWPWRARSKASVQSLSISSISAPRPLKNHASSRSFRRVNAIRPARSGVPSEARFITRAL